MRNKLGFGKMLRVVLLFVLSATVCLTWNSNANARILDECNGDANCESGFYDGIGGSQVQGKVWTHESGDQILVRMDYYAVQASFHSFSCYLNAAGQGYLITGFHPIIFIGSDGHRIVTNPVDYNPFRLWRDGNTYGYKWYNSIPKTSLHPGVKYTVTLPNGVFMENDRKHICSRTPDAPVLESGAYWRPAEWTINGQSYIGKWGRDGTNHVKNRLQGENAFRVRPGQTLYWDHDLRNNGPDNMLSNVTVNIDHQDRDLTSGSQLVFFSNPSGDKASGKVNELFYDKGPVTDWKVTQDAVGRKVCQRIAWQKAAWNNDNWGHSNYACANVPYDYRPPTTPPDEGDPDVPTETPPLDAPECKRWGCGSGYRDTGATPHAKLADGSEDVIFMGDSQKFDYSVSNGKNSYTKTMAMPYQAYTFILKGSESDMSARIVNRGGGDGFANATPSAIFGRDSVRYSTTSTGTTPEVSRGSSESLGSATVDLKTEGPWSVAQPGDKICSYVALDKWAVTNGEPDPTIKTSTIACVDVGKKPQLQVRGGDSKADQGFEGSTFKSSNAINVNRGSFSQYGLLSLRGKVNAFGSNGYTFASKNVFGNRRCRITYANSNSFGTTDCSELGKFSTTASAYESGVPEVDESKTKAIGGSIDLSNIAQSGLYKVNGDASIRGSLKTGNDVTIVATGDVTIDSNIANSGSYNSLREMPNIVVYSTGGEIKINSNVSEVDATLIAKKLNTCGDASSEKTLNTDLGIGDGHKKCNNGGPLKINGAIITTDSGDSLKLYRTFGSGNTTKYDEDNPKDENAWDPSEIVNLSPNSFLVPFAKYGSQTNIKTYRTKEVHYLPVRY